jgi:hypothetical protein
MGQTLKNLAVREDQLLVGLPAIATYLLAGKAKVTLHNVNSGVRHAYRVEVAKVKTDAGGWKSNHGAGPWHVWSHTAEGWQGVGYVRRNPHQNGTLQFLNETCRKVRRVLPASDERVQGFRWLVGRLVRGVELPKHAQVWRSNRCGRCAAELISHYKVIGYGPTCCGHLHIDAHAIFNRLASLGEAPLNRRLEVVREMVYGNNLSKADQTALSLLPGIAGDYAKAHLNAA